MSAMVELDEVISELLRGRYRLASKQSDDLLRSSSKKARLKRSKQSASQKCNRVESPIVVDNAYDGEVDNSSEVTMLSRDGPKLQSPTKSNAICAQTIRSSAADVKFV